MKIDKKIRDAVKKFKLNLTDKNVLTEAASGNYVVTSVIAALAGANVTAFTRESAYGTVSEVTKQTYELAGRIGVSDKIRVVEDLNDVDLGSFDILTNTGFLRPIDEKIISKLSSGCVIPLMWEPWEYREEDLNLEACCQKGIKVYGTNEGDDNLQTMSYLGYIALKFLLQNNLSPFSAKVLLIGSDKFVEPVEGVLRKNNYVVKTITDYEEHPDVKEYDFIVLLEHENPLKIIGHSNSFISVNDIAEESFVLHICGTVDFSGAEFQYAPAIPKKFGYMSYTTDFIDSKAVVDLHTAGLKVAEGMLAAKSLELSGIKYKEYMEKNYPALAFADEKYW